MQSFQPVTASLFIWNKIIHDPLHGFTKKEEKEIIDLKNEFNSIFNKEGKMSEIFMFRINAASEPTMRSFRRDVSDTIKFIN